MRNKEIFKDVMSSMGEVNSPGDKAGSTCRMRTVGSNGSAANSSFLIYSSPLKVDETNEMTISRSSDKTFGVTGTEIAAQTHFFHSESVSI